MTAGQTSARIRRAWAAVTALALAFGLAACAPSDPDSFPEKDARPLTTEEAQLLAAMRFRNFDAGARSISLQLEERGRLLSLEGWVDYGNGVGYGRLAAEDGAGETDLLLWNHRLLCLHPGEGETAPVPIPDADALATAWQGRALDPSSSRLDTVLAILLQLGADRPENPLLLQQSGSLWLGEREVDGRALTVFAGPPSDEALAPGATADPAAATIRYGVDETGTLHLLSMRIGGEAGWTDVTLGEADGITLGDPFASLPGSDTP